jgi:hypothetical protein
MLAGKGNGCHPNKNWRRGRSSDRRQSRLHRVTITRLTTTDHDKDRHEYVGDLDRERATTVARATAGTEVHAEPDAPTTRRGGRGAKSGDGTDGTNNPLKRFRVRLTGPRGRERAAVRFAVRVRGRCPGDNRVSTGSSQGRRARVRNAGGRLPRSPRGQRAPFQAERSTCSRPSLGSK